MPDTVSPIPSGYHAVTPYLIIKGAAKAIDFYKAAFGATEVMRLDAPGGKLGHAEIEIGGSRIMMSDEWEEGACRGPLAYGGSPVSIHLYVPNVDATVEAAVAAGATLREPVEDKFYGDRSGTLVDPFGHVWHVSTHIEELNEEEMKRRADEFMAQMAEG